MNDEKSSLVDKIELLEMIRTSHKEIINEVDKGTYTHGFIEGLNFAMQVLKNERKRKPKYLYDVCVGKKYKTRSGEIVEILTKYNGEVRYPYGASNDVTYTKIGLAHENQISPRDLVEEIE